MVHINRNTTDFPLIFNSEWKYLFLDALLPANNPSLQKLEIQINDINIFDNKCHMVFINRVREHIGSLIYSLIDKVMIHLPIPAQHSEIGQIKSFLHPDCDDNNLDKYSDGGKFKQALTDRIMFVLKDIDKGALDCLRQTLKCATTNKKCDMLNDKASIRSIVMEKLIEKIKHHLIQILSIVMENGNFQIYCDDEIDYKYGWNEEQGAHAQQRAELRKLWLKLFNEPRIVRLQMNSKYKSPMDTSSKMVANFPFSSNVHNYVLSFRSDVFAASKFDEPIEESSKKGQQIINTTLRKSLKVANLSLQLNNLSPSLIKHLLYDIVQLEKCNLGISKYSNHLTTHLVHTACAFLWQSGKEMKNRSYDSSILDRVRRNHDRVSTNGGIVGLGLFMDNHKYIDFDSSSAESDDYDSSSDDTATIVIVDDSDDNGEKKHQNPDSNSSDGSDGSDGSYSEEVNFDSVQISDIYAALWTNERLLIEIITVLSSLRDSSHHLTRINKAWQGNNLIACIAGIMTELLQELKCHFEYALADTIKYRMDYLVSISSSFEYVLQYLERNNCHTFGEIKRIWDSIHLALLIVRCCPNVDGEFIKNQWTNYGDYRFHSACRLRQLLIGMKMRMIKNQDGHSSEDKLQWFLQSYIRYFAIGIDESSTIDWEFKNYVECLVKLLGDTKHKFVQKLGIKPNLFTKYEIVSMLLNSIAINKDSLSNTTNNSINYNRVNILKKINFIKDLFTCCIEETDSMTNLLCVLVVNVEVQRLCRLWDETHDLSIIYSPSTTEFHDAGNALNKSLSQGSKLEQLTCIARCKTLLWNLARYIKNLNLTIEEDGLFQGKGRNKQKRKKKDYLTKIGNMFTFEHDKSKRSENRMSVKRGLQYYFLTLFWHELGAQNTVKMFKNSVFHRVLQFTILKDEFPHICGMTIVNGDDHDVAPYIPKDNPFQLPYVNTNLQDNNNEYIELMEEIENAFACNRSLDKSETFVQKFKQKHLILLVGGMFNFGFLRGGERCWYKEIVMNFVEEHATPLLMKSNSLGQLGIDDEKENNCKVIVDDSRVAKRMYGLLAKLVTNCSDEKQMRLAKYEIVKDGKGGNAKHTRSANTLEDVQFIRLQWHLIGVLLSISLANPLSILFHNPLLYKKQYLIGMPEDQSASLLKAMAGHGVWLCPNDHIYFIGNCTTTNESGTCKTCGAPIGNKVGAGGHFAAKGNRKVGRIDKDGKIKADKYGATEGVANYDPETLSPKGYIYIDSHDDKCRELSNLNVRIVRLIVNLILLTHCSEHETSDCKEFTQLGGTDERVFNSLKKLCKRYISEIGKQLGNLSYESVIYLMHAIIHRLHVKSIEYETQLKSKSEKRPVPLFNMRKGLSTGTRKEFEAYLVRDCIDPVINNIQATLSEIHLKISADRIVTTWAPRMNETLNTHDEKQEGAGFEFARKYLVNLYLPIETLNVSTLVELILIINEKNATLAEQFPIIYGLCKTIDGTGGYSVFTLQYLPLMLSWMRLIYSRFNRRVTFEDVTQNGDEYNARYVLNEGDEEGWGNKNYSRAAFEGFVKGWNDLADIVTVDDSKVGENADGEESTINYNPLKKLVTIQDVCTNVSIPKIVSKHGREVRPIDVPIVYAIDAGEHNDLATSIQIRKILEHYIACNNNVLINCFKINPNDHDTDGNNNGNRLLPAQISSKKISRASDVVDIGEHELNQIVQESYLQRYEYGIENIGNDKYDNLISRLNLPFVRITFKRTIYH